MRYDLYINNQRCDLNDESLIVFTYTMEDLRNPTAVKNTYSHEVELPSTDNNNRIFSHFYRNDYRVGVDNFQPLQRVPFAIYNELSERVQSGYIKLDEVTIDHTKKTYKVTLYGGLGSFFYTLGYNDDGDALTLADLQYMPQSEDEARLNLEIRRQTIDNRGAWGRLAGANSREEFDVINFAPTYQGLPEGDFGKDKALFIGRATGSAGNYGNDVQHPIYGIVSAKDGNTFYKRFTNGEDTGYRFSLVDLGKEHTEWEMKDLRTYLQRPILSIRKFVEAVQRRASAYGYTLELDGAFFNDDNPYYANAWMTLPSLQSITKPSNTAEVRISGEVVVDGNAVQTIPLSVDMPTDIDGYEFGSNVKNVKLSLPEISVEVDDDTNTYQRGKAFYLSDSNNVRNAWFIQVYGKRFGSNVATSDVKVITATSDGNSTDFVVQNADFLPVGSANVYTRIKSNFTAVSSRYAVLNTKNIEFDITSTSAPDSWYLKIRKVTYQGDSSYFDKLLTLVGLDGYGHDITGWVDISAGIPTTLSGTGEVSANTTIRTGAIVQKKDLLNIGKSPLEILLSYCKLFGLVWLYGEGYTIRLLSRAEFYGEGNPFDWNARIDRSRPMVVKPFEFDKRFYDFELETQGQWAERYEEKWGKVYGSQRVNTGYDFDKDSKNLLEGNALKGGAEVLEIGKYYNNITEGTYTLGSRTFDKVCPSVFLDGGKFALYDANGNATQYDTTTPTTDANIDYMNALQGYDAQPKAQLHNDGKVDTAGGMLLLYDGDIDVANSPYKNFRLSDDIAEMGILNDGQLCWLLEGSSVARLGADPTTGDGGETLPKFVRTGLGVTLDMGTPLELDNPDADTEAVQNTIYAQYWRNYIADRYDTNSRVCECYVDLRGVRVNNALFQNTYYFDNAVWVLNKISNYSMTTEGSTLCEFVKVQDINAYMR